MCTREVARQNGRHLFLDLYMDTVLFRGSSFQLYCYSLIEDNV